jgi:hypothetical protein
MVRRQKIALLKAEESACVSELANVLFVRLVFIGLSVMFSVSLHER